MFRASSLYALSFSFITIATALILPLDLSNAVANTTQANPNDNTISSTGSELEMNLDAFRSPSNDTLLKDTQVRCSRPMFGTVTYQSCLHALNTLAVRPSRVYTFGQRDAGLFDINLPFRLIGSDGLCAFDIGIQSPQFTARASGAQIAAAANELLRACAFNTRGRGGDVTGVGVNGVLYISMYRYDPGHIECGAEPRPGFQDGCNKMAQGINAAKGDQTFGKAGDTGVQQGLPYISMTPSPAACLVVVRSSDGKLDTRDVTSFYKLWEAFTGIQALCVRYNKVGKAYGLGKLTARDELSSLRAPM